MRATNLFADGNRLTFPNRKRLAMDYKVLEIILIDNILVVVLSVPVDVIFNNNVYAYDLDGKFLWQINVVKGVHYFGQDQCPFVGMNDYEDNCLLLYNWCSSTLRVDIKTGVILERIETR
jgi:hypothetical protein